jgi:prepilin signal peptidase PulO-like enzyme (type II secretory pathway)
MLIYSLIITIILGLAIGSFLNVLIFRLPKGLSVWKKSRSFCPHCKKDLKPWMMIPVFSFLFLKGRCAYCQKKISWQYPIVELVTAALFVFIFINNLPIKFEIFFIAKVLLEWLFSSALIVIFVIDWKHYLILDKTLYPLMPVVFLVNFWLSGWNLKFGLWLLIAAAIGFAFYAFQYYVSKGKWVGDADMRLGALLGLMLGVKGLLVSLFLAYIVGAIIGTILVLLKKKKMTSQLPMAIFLAPAAFIAMLYSTQILIWYFEMFVW